MIDFMQCECDQPNYIISEPFKKRVSLTVRNDDYHMPPRYYVLILMYLQCPKCKKYQYGLMVWHWNISRHEGETEVSYSPVMSFSDDDKAKRFRASLRNEAIEKHGNEIQKQIIKHQAMLKDKSE